MNSIFFSKLIIFFWPTMNKNADNTKWGSCRLLAALLLKYTKYFSLCVIKSRERNIFCCCCDGEKKRSQEASRLCSKFTSKIVIRLNVFFVLPSLFRKFRWKLCTYVKHTIYTIFSLSYIEKSHLFSNETPCYYNNKHTYMNAIPGIYNQRKQIYDQRHAIE